MRMTVALKSFLVSACFVITIFSGPRCKLHPPVVGDSLLVPQKIGPALPGFVWYPAPRVSSEVNPPEQGSLPLIVMSHGLWGNSRSLDSLMRALAGQGFVAAAIDHDEYRGYFLLAPDSRTDQLHGLTDYMINHWPGRSRIDPRRIGAFGFSLGGFTVLVAAGGKPDVYMMLAHCKDAGEEWSCAMERAKHLDLLEHPPSASAWVADPRIRAVAALAPAMGYLFGTHGLAGVQIPIQLWQGDRDSVLRAPWNAEIVQRELPHPADYQVVAGDHGDLLTPCSRNADHQSECAGRQAMFQRQVADFFRRSLH